MDILITFNNDNYKEEDIGTREATQQDFDSW